MVLIVPGREVFFRVMYGFSISCSQAHRGLTGNFTMTTNKLDPWRHNLMDFVKRQTKRKSSGEGSSSRGDIRSDGRHVEGRWKDKRTASLGAKLS